MRQIIIASLCVLVAVSCKKQNTSFTLEGQVVDPFAQGLPGITLETSEQTAVTDADGNFQLELTSPQTLQPIDSNFYFVPQTVHVSSNTAPITLQGFYQLDNTSQQVVNWLVAQQLPNGLLESAEDGNVVSLYDQALAALVFLSTGRVTEAERIFDFFQDRISTELQQEPGGFAQLRDRNGVPNNHRWMGDNAWLLIALHHYRSATQNPQYDALEHALESWLRSLQDTDGGLFAGYTSDNTLLNYKVTEGMIDAYVAVPGYDTFHQQLLGYLEADLWDATDQNLMAWPTNPPYKWALDNFSWAYCSFPGYPVATLDAADRFRTTQTATVTGNLLEGYDIDEDQETIFMEGTGQMALAFHRANRMGDKQYFLSEMRKAYFDSPTYFNAGGFPYASNPGSGYGSDPLWPTAPTEIALSGGAWYVLAQTGFNPLRIGLEKAVPVADRFW